ncbi:MAG: transglutaminase family protein [Bryobacteraceae bacterium]|nr:transglutaminase family protein [Bryobacteraceae bacterium]MDW8379582.1 transglutaminase family protein [Bryobacterales bacterium]
MFYAIRHTTRFQYDKPVTETVMEVRKHPRTEGNQRCLNHVLRVTPRARVFSYRDYLGNIVHHFDVPGRYTRLVLVAESLVELEPPAELIPLTADDWAELDYLVQHGDYWEMLTPSHFARPSHELHQLRMELNIQREADPLTTVLAAKQKIHDFFEYQPSLTRVDSPIEEAIRLRKGVCQDFAHIYIAIMRELRIPARYVSGYLFHNRAIDRSAEGATHAWVEVLLPKNGWVGVDPTNRLVACERHVRTAIGRDYADVPPTRGVYKGEAKGELSVTVRVTQSEAPIEAPADSGLSDQWVPISEAEGAADYFHQQQQQQQ